MEIIESLTFNSDHLLEISEPENELRLRRETRQDDLKLLFASVNDQIDEIESTFEQSQFIFYSLVERETEIISKLTSLESRYSENDVNVSE